MQTYEGGKKSIKPCHAARKKRLQTLLFCYQLHKHLIPQTSPRLLVLHLPPGPFRKPTGGMARDNLTRTHIIYSLPSLLLLEELFLFLFFFFFCSSVCEDQVGKVRLQPVPGNHLTEFWRAIVWEFKVRAQAALAEGVQVLIHKRQGEVS